MVTAQSLTFPVLSDPGNEVARRYGLVFTLPESLRPLYAQFGIDIPTSNGDDTFELPVPATYVIDESGTIRTLALSGEASIMTRYQGHVTVFRATVPLGVKVPEYSFSPQTLVDRHTQRKWQALGLMPSALTSDHEFARRVYLDITGTLPTPKQLTEFVADKDAAKRDKLVDRLLETPEYAYYFANKWADILRVKRRQQQDRAAGTFAFHDWIRQQVANDTPYSEYVRGVLTATGDERKSSPTVWFKEIEKPEQFVDDVSQVFLG